MTNEEMILLMSKYKNEYSPPGDLDHRVDAESEAITYSLIREYKPTSVLEIGTWEGGTTCLIMSALLKNKKPFEFVASELLDDKRRMTEENVKRACGEVPKIIGEIRNNYHSIPKELDMFFLDTDHDVPVTAWVIQKVFPRLKKGGLFILHDWAVKEAADGSWFGKGDNGVGGWPETQIFMQMHKEGIFPFEKLFWNYKNPNDWELGAFIKI